MPKILSQEQIAQFERDGFLPGIPVLSPDEVRYFRGRLEGFEARYPEHVKKLKSKSHLLCPWVVELAENKRLLDVFEDLLGPDILCWSMAWRVKKPDGKTFAGWHQDSVYLPVDLTLRPGEMALINNAIVHCSGPNASSDRRIMVLVEMTPTKARHPGRR